MNVNRRLFMGVLVAVFVWLPVHAQSTRSLINGGNTLYEKEKFDDAEVSYRKALEKEPGLVQGHFNLGNSLYKGGKFEESVSEYQSALQAAQDPTTKAWAYYNIGNSLVKAQNYQDAIKAYIQSLKIAPDDQQTKYNLSYALSKLRDQQQQKNDQKQSKNDQQQHKQQQQNQDQKKQDQQRQHDQQQAQQERRMSRADAQRILDVLKNNERDVQKKLRTRPATRVKPEKDW